MAPDAAQTPGEPIDALLQPLLERTPPGAHEQLLASLLQDQARPVIRAVIRRELMGRGPGGIPIEDTEDVESAVIAQILTRLRDLAHGFDVSPIRDFRAYVAVAAFHGCHALVRQRHPERARLKNRLRYLLSHDPRFAVWESRSSRRLCGLRAWHGQDESTGAARKTLHAVTAPPDDAEPVEEVRAVLAIFRSAGAPVELDDLTSAVAEALNIRDQPAARDEQGGVERLIDPAVSVETELADRASIRRLWDEVCQLPVRQRIALLLNLRDPEGGGALTLLPATGVASIRAIAVVLDMPAAELAAMWGTLPHDDARIAERLGVTRQQVINLRKAARDRLGRRTRLAATTAGNTARGTSS